MPSSSKQQVLHQTVLGNFLPLRLSVQLQELAFFHQLACAYLLAHLLHFMFRSWPLSGEKKHSSSVLLPHTSRSSQPCLVLGKVSRLSAKKSSIQFRSSCSAVLKNCNGSMISNTILHFLCSTSCSDGRTYHWSPMPLHVIVLPLCLAASATRAHRLCAPTFVRWRLVLLFFCVSLVALPL